MEPGIGRDDPCWVPSHSGYCMLLDSRAFSRLSVPSAGCRRQVRAQRVLVARPGNGLGGTGESAGKGRNKEGGGGKKPKTAFSKSFHVPPSLELPKCLVPAGLQPLSPNCHPHPGNYATLSLLQSFILLLQAVLGQQNLFPFFPSQIFYQVIRCKIQKVSERMLICTSQVFLFLELSGLFSGLLFSFFSGLLFSFFSPPFFTLSLFFLLFSSFFFFFFFFKSLSSFIFFPLFFFLPLLFLFSLLAGKQPVRSCNVFVSYVW